jgi:hypothetical protein
MTDITLVGSTVKYDATTAWPTSLALTDADVPGGTQLNDRLVLIVASIQSGAARDVSDFNLSSDWRTEYALPPAASSSNNSPILYIYSAQYGFPGVLDQVVQPRKSDGSNATAQTSWGYVLASLSPSRSSVGADSAFTAGGNPTTGISGTVNQYRLDVVLVPSASTLTFVGGTPSVASTTTYFNRLNSKVANRWGGIGIGDLTHDRTFSGGSGWCRWSVASPSRRFQVAIDFSATDDSPLVSGADWCIGRIAY